MMMAKMQRTAKWDNCPFTLFPFGRGMPVCAYGVKPREDISLKYFFHCMDNGICRKEQAEKGKTQTQEPEYADGSIRPDGQFKGQLSVDDIIKETPKTFYHNSFNYYSFCLNGETKTYCTSVTNDTPQDIYEWAERFGFISEEDIPHCTDGRLLSAIEVQHEKGLDAVQLD